MLVEYLHNVVSQLQLRDLNTGELIRTLPTGLGTIGGLSGDIYQTEIFYSYSSFTEPGSTYRCAHLPVYLYVHVSTQIRTLHMYTHTHTHIRAHVRDNTHTHTHTERERERERER